ncbi:nickel-dependent hydrogenase large subunit [Methanocella arvoryzae]|nr:nickel-dependent hydrogenase large subunit [Methanocella arvoryzae]
MKDGSVVDARCSGTTYRGFEQMMIGRDPMDAVYFTQRVCGMCSTPHATAAAGAVESLAGATGQIPKDALLVRNILNGLAWLRSHVENLYLSFLPDLADPIYGDLLRYSDVGTALTGELAGRFNVPGYASTGHTAPGSAYTDAIRFVKLTGEAEAILGGRSPHSPVIVPGGVTVRPSASDLMKLKGCYASIVDFLERRLTYPLSLDEWLENTHSTQANPDFILNRIKSLPTGDLSMEKGWNDMQLFSVFCSRMMSYDFLSMPIYVELDTLGGYPLYDQLIGFLNYGGFYRVRDRAGNFTDGYSPVDGEEGTFEIPSGFTPGSMPNLFDSPGKADPAMVAEQVSGSFFSYSGGETALKPEAGETSPSPRAADIDYSGHKYSFVKAPRYGNVPCETGPLARMINSREPYIMNIMQMMHFSNPVFSSGKSYNRTSVYTRVLSRMQECLITAQLLGRWIDDLEVHSDPRKYCVPVTPGRGEAGACMIEAPRGALGHWMRLDEDGRIAGYQIISPTTWNASPRDAETKFGPIELSLIGAKTTPRGNIPGSEVNPISLYHIIRSFDPCVSCAVHTIRTG